MPVNLHEPLAAHSGATIGGGPLRIAFVLSSLGAGGAERVIAQVSEHFAVRGTKVTVIAFDHPNDPVFHRFHPDVRLVRLGLPPAGCRLASALQVGRRIRRLRKVLQEGGFDVVISFLIKVNVLTLAASAGLNFPVIVSERSNPLRQAHHAVWRALVALTYPRAAAIVLQTERARICLPAGVRARAVVIRNPASLRRRSQPVGTGRLQCVAVGRLTHQKGFDLLLYAWAEVAERYPDWRLMIWGEGPERSALEQQCEALGLGDRVMLPGNTSVPGTWVEGASLFILPSRYEGSPNVLAEAMAAGVPAIAADCDFGPAELIEDGRDGLLFPVEDAPALAGGMVRMMGDESLRRKIGEAGHTRVIRDLCPDVVMGQWSELVGNVLGSRAMTVSLPPAPSRSD